MEENKKNVLILFGGKSGEHEVSIVSAFNVARSLDAQKYQIYFLGVDKKGRQVFPSAAEIWKKIQKNDLTFDLDSEKSTVCLLPYRYRLPIIAVEGIEQKNLPVKIDVILPIVHGTNCEDGSLQGLLELGEIPYIGPGVLASAVGMDKDVAKRLFRECGIPVVPYFVVDKNEFSSHPEEFVKKAKREFGLPYFIKPANAGSSVGVHKVKNEQEALVQWKDTFQFDQKILVEKAIQAREVEVAVLGAASLGEIKASVPGEVTTTHDFYSYQAKYQDTKGITIQIPALNLSAKQIDQLQEYAIRAFRAIESCGMTRVDFFVEKNSDAVYLNEVNTIPGFTNVSMYPMMWEKSGLAYSDLLDKLIAIAMQKRQQKKEIVTEFL